MLSHFLGGDLLARSEDEDFLDPSLEVQVAVPIKITQIAAVEPAIFKGLPGSRLILKITGDDVVAPDEDLSDALGVRMPNPDLHPVQWPARRPQAGSLRGIDGDPGEVSVRP